MIERAALCNTRGERKKGKKESGRELKGLGYRNSWRKRGIDTEIENRKVQTSTHTHINVYRNTQLILPLTLSHTHIHTH